jgi:hypothetical protein
MARFNVTYEIITPESAEDGEAESMGFVCQDVTLREAVEAMGRAATEDSGRWFTHTEYGHDYATGAEESRSLHPPRGISAASYGRLCRLLGVRMARGAA